MSHHRDNSMAVYSALGKRLLFCQKITGKTQNNKLDYFSLSRIRSSNASAHYIFISILYTSLKYELNIYTKAMKNHTGKQI